MSAEELTIWLFALAFSAVGMALGALVCALMALRRISRLKKDVSTAFNSLAQKQNSSRKELNELLTGNIGIIKKFQDFQESVERLSDKQADLELKEPEGRMYSRAKKMIQLGAGLEEVVRECEIPLPEAELLFRVLGKSPEGDSGTPPVSLAPKSLEARNMERAVKDGIARNKEHPGVSSPAGSGESGSKGGHQAMGMQEAFKGQIREEEARIPAEALEMMRKFKNRSGTPAEK
nr:DUF2802 domain-containing protein [Succinimonas amylolytica]